jgi:hypothetical protein
VDLDEVYRSLHKLKGYFTLTYHFTAFQISAEVKIQGNNVPVNIPSTMTLNKLKIKMGEMFNGFPGLLKLWYRLSTDKASKGATAIFDDNQFSIFIEQVQPLFLPKLNKNGSESKQQ